MSETNQCTEETEGGKEEEMGMGNEERSGSETAVRQRGDRREPGGWGDASR